MKSFVAMGIAIGAITTAAAQTPAPAAPNPNQRFMASLQTINPLNTSSIVFSATGSAAVSTDPKKPAALAPVKKYTVAINYGMNMSRVDIERNGSPKRISQFLANDIAWDVVDNKKPEAKPGAAAERLRQMFMTPHGAVRAAFDPAAKRQMTLEDGVAVANFQVAGSQLKAYFDDKALITRVQTASGDVEFLYSEYKDVDTIKPAAAKPGGPPSGGILFPSRIIQKVNGQTVLDLTLTEAIPNAGLYVEVPEAVEKAMAKK